MRFLFIPIIVSVVVFACSRPTADSPGGGTPSALSAVAAVRLNFRYEADVPPPDAPRDGAKEDRNAAVQADFDATRPQEVLERTVTSPDAKRVLTVYSKAGDRAGNFRLDMYSSDGRLLRKITSDSMAVHFPDTIRWSPDSTAVAFVAMTRIEPLATGAEAENNSVIKPQGDIDPTTTIPVSPTPGSDPEANANAGIPQTAPTPASPTGILTFRTEQIYICNADGDAAKAITQNEGLMYFYYVWSPDSTMLAALAAKAIEWNYLEGRAEAAGELLIPVGRPRVIEKNGRERRLDDALTAVQPVWSPDSAKIACAFDNQVRVYDAAGNAPTQAAIPLRNHLLLSSQAYDRDQATKLDANVQPDANAAPATNTNAAAPTTLPDEKTLVSYNPIVGLNWSADNLLYFQTAYIKRMKNEA
ncbi:MAG TPA: hypothetical protein VNA22_04405, partial [Pyrinomonadaceae bacterium]|nr:hypothetical protein [Pyrinomonadaceae bacterium]